MEAILKFSQNIREREREGNCEDCGSGPQSNMEFGTIAIAIVKSQKARI